MHAFTDFCPRFAFVEEHTQDFRSIIYAMVLRLSGGNLKGFCRPRLQEHCTRPSRLRPRMSALMQTPFIPAIVTPFKPGSLKFDSDKFKEYLKVPH